MSIAPDVDTQGSIVNAEGEGEGWGSGDEHYSQADWAFTYTFTPTQSGYYAFNVFVTAYGPYYLFADDDWWESKEAYLSLSARLLVTNQGNVNTSPVIDLYDDGDDNIDHQGYLLGQGWVNTDRIWLLAGVQISAAVDIRCNVKAKGDGSQATAVLGLPNGFVQSGPLIVSLV
jgi:hypothetical protein